jgi:CIC family chloride channel protein
MRPGHVKSLRRFDRLTALFVRWRTLALRVEVRLAPTEPQRLFILTLVIGGVCGVAAVGFHAAIFFATHQLIDRAFVAHGWTWIPWTIATPTLGGVLCGVLLKYVFPDARGSGIPQVKVAYASRSGSVPLRDAVGKFLVGTLQIGTGASLGLEGPTVQICAGLASTLGRAVRFSPQSRRRLIPVGAAAGIAAAFNAPIAAVTFTIEELVGQLDQTVLSGVIIAAAIAAVVERSVLGENPVLTVHEHYGLSDPRSLLLYAVLGIAAACASVAFTDGLLGLRARFRRSSLPLWVQPAIGGAVTGVLAVGVMAWCHIGGVTGGGYGVLEHALWGSLPVRVMLVLGVTKLIATVFSYSSGGAGGIFAPSLFIGAMLGGAFGSLDRTLFHHDDIGAFALVGMGAVFSATVRAPMTSVLIIVEMTSGYSLILPLMIANMSAYVIARRWRREPIYDALLSQDGIHLRDRAVLTTLEVLRLDKLVARVNGFACFSRASRPSEMLHESVVHHDQKVFPVIDGATGKLVGLVTSEEVAMLEGEPHFELLVTAADVMRGPVCVRVNDDLRTIFELMRAEGLREVPVVDEDNGVLGLVDEGDVAQVYLRATSGTE